MNRPVLCTVPRETPTSRADRIRWAGRPVDLVHDPRRQDVVVFHGPPSTSVHDGMTQVGFVLTAAAGRDRLYVRDRVALARLMLREGRAIPTISSRGVELP